ncbi:hypothetical protein [Fimbriiglobus ruber]|uniref:Uncharacterized protein n=1 Tax=Fimbriiglobus ruber TaxID=1908690 RepID=A0A225DUA4_9BACT|nr:hypothetical protein [Fimbriiglobus ruber]OWK39985.1 hypothetical protein FRUB_05875 [Fimbriiglobus ruber]OWK40135.1 hypothetical protein FRUB_05054 [Fimbriiglobus ruber]
MPPSSPDRVVFDELHVTLLVPRTLPIAAAKRVRQVVDGRPFVARLRRAIVTVVARHTALRAVTVTVAR